MTSESLIFGRLTVLRREGKNAHCICECGVERVVLFSSLRRGNTRSCGCLARERRVAMGRANKTHGMKKTPTYKSWDGMRYRCLSPHSVSYPYYGARGIKVCERWNKFENFLADMGERPAGMTLERIDTNGDYEPSNCRWATPVEQTRNRRITAYIEIDGERRILGEVCAERGVSAQLVHGRLRSGWPVDDRLFCPSLIPGPRPSRRKSSDI